MGKFLVSDAAGLATWQSTSATLSGTYWSLSGNTIGVNDFLGSINARDLVFKTNGVERMRLTSTGNIVGLGNATPNSALLSSLALGSNA